MAEANPVRILMHKKQRKLTNKRVRSLLTEYVKTGTIYKALSEKYGISQKSIGNIVGGLTYRELPGIADLRKKAQEKAAAQRGRHSGAKAVRVPDATKALIEVDSNSTESIDAAIVHLQGMRSLLGPSADEVSFL